MHGYGERMCVQQMHPANKCTCVSTSKSKKHGKCSVEMQGARVVLATSIALLGLQAQQGGQVDRQHHPFFVVALQLAGKKNTK
jgi:hypothetical protein